MAIFQSAGHNIAGSKPDPGAVATHNGKQYTEAALMAAFRDLVVAKLKEKGAKVITDLNTETLGQYLARIEPGTGSVCHECHLNAGPEAAQGIEVIIPERHTTDEYNLAKEMVEAGVRICGLKSRGVKTESQTHRKKLAFMREEGINVLSEICFISNWTDLKKFLDNQEALAQAWADLLVKYDAKYS